MIIEKAAWNDLDEMERFYEAVCDHLEATVNYPGWKKGIYPARNTAERGIATGSLYVLRDAQCLAGSFIIDQKPEETFSQADWRADWTDQDVLIVHTLAVHPAYIHRGLGKQMICWIAQLARESGIKALRLDVHEKNEPAQRLYRQCGFEYIDTIVPRYGGEFDRTRFDLYQKRL